MTRLRDLGVRIGRLEPGPYNAITDVEGVRVGHSTLISGHGPLVTGVGPVRTGVTAVLPNADNVFHKRVFGGAFVLNGAGEMSGLIQVLEWGLIETPILLTNTFSVGAVSEAVVRHMTARHPGIGRELDVVIPLVGECDDSYLNDIAGRHVRAVHVDAAIASARGGPVQEGSVGGGTGMVAFDLKGGIGTSSRVLRAAHGGYTIGILLMSNVGRLGDLRLDGYPLGRRLSPVVGSASEPQRECYGSIICVVATDAPLLTHQLSRLAKRAALGIGRVGSYAAHGSGEIVIAFSTPNTVSRELREPTSLITVLDDRCMNPLYGAAIEATEEAMLNAMVAAETMVGIDGRVVEALPHQAIREAAEVLRRTPWSGP